MVERCSKSGVAPSHVTSVESWDASRFSFYTSIQSFPAAKIQSFALRPLTRNMLNVDRGRQAIDKWKWLGWLICCLWSMCLFGSHKSSRKNSQPLSWVERLQTLQKCTWCRYFVLPTKTATWTFTSSKFTSATDKVFHAIPLGILDFYVFLTMLVSAKSLPMGSPALLWIPPNRWRDSKFKGV